MSETFVPGLRYRTRSHQLWALVVESLGEWERRMDEASAATGLSPASVWALVQLDPERPICQKELAARLHCNPSTVVNPTDRLEERGLVARRPNPADRRVNVLVVTPAGVRVRDELLERLLEPPAAFRSLPAADAERFGDLMLATFGRSAPGPAKPKAQA